MKRQLTTDSCRRVSRAGGGVSVGADAPPPRSRSNGRVLRVLWHRACHSELAGAAMSKNNSLALFTPLCSFARSLGVSGSPPWATHRLSLSSLAQLGTT